MSKVLNWFFGSFFRTLGRLLVFILLGYLLFNIIDFSSIKLPNLFGVLKVNAATYSFNEVITNSKVYINNYQLTTTNKFYTNSGVNEFKLYSDSVWDYYDENTPSYAYITVCQAYPSENTVSSTGYFTTNATVYNTSIPCKVFGTDAYPNAVLMHIALQFNLGPSSTTPVRTMCTTGATTTLCQLDNSIDINLPRTQEFSLVSYGFSKEPFQYDNASSALINQNQTIINNLGQINTDINGVSNNITNSTNSIINNQNQNKTDIINNQNENTDREIESQKVCQQIDRNSIYEDNIFLNSNGAIISNVNYGITDYINVNNAKVKLLSQMNQSSAYTCFYNINKTLISCLVNQNLGIVGEEITLPATTIYMRVSIHKVQNRPTFEVCKNGNQAIGDNLSDINNALTDDSPPTNLDSLNNSAGWLPAGPVDSILNLPLSFLTNLNTNLSKSCQPVNLPLPYINKNLPLPCVNTLYNEITGLPNWINIIGTIASAFILFGYFINLYKYVDDTLTFRENNYIDNWSGV